MENFKTDQQISDEFNNFKLEQIDFEISHKKANVFECMIAWEFPEAEESVGGGSTTIVEHFFYDTKKRQFHYRVNNWVPDDVYEKQILIIGKELGDKYTSKPFKNSPNRLT